jgi:competence protein ComEA
MKRLLVLAAAAAVAVLALRRPAPGPAIASVSAPPAGVSQHSSKEHSSPGNAQAVVYVVGAVMHPGLYRLRTGDRINDAVRRAGGLRGDADPAAVNLAERVMDGQEIHVPRVGEATPAPSRRANRKHAVRALAASAAAIDINAADESELAAIPGIGQTLATRIVEYRKINGPFASLDELADVAGMTQRRIDAMAAYVSINTLH